MSPTRTADPALIPEIESFKEMGGIAEYNGGLTSQDARIWPDKLKKFDIRTTTGDSLELIP